MKRSQLFWSGSFISTQILQITIYLKSQYLLFPGHFLLINVKHYFSISHRKCCGTRKIDWSNCSIRCTVPKKINNFLKHKIFFCSIILFSSTWNIFWCNILNLLLPTQDYFSCIIILFLIAFRRTSKCLFWTLYKTYCHGDIFLLSRGKKNIITCQKNIKFHFYVTQQH